MVNNEGIETSGGSWLNFKFEHLQHSNNPHCSLTQMFDGAVGAIISLVEQF